MNKPDSNGRGRTGSQSFSAALLAAAVGDALGWPQEPNNQRLRDGRTLNSEPSGRFDSWSRKIGGRFWGAREVMDPGSYSDDTQLLIATTRAILQGGDNWCDFFRYVELPAWLLYERGGGRATKTAAQLWAEETPPWRATKTSLIERYFEAGGNGVAMRVLPHGFAATSWEHLRKDVLANGVTTHGHPHALIGALLYAVAVRVATRKSGQWQLGEMLTLLRELREIWEVPPTGKDAPSEWLESSSIHSRRRYESSWLDVSRETAGALRSIETAVDKGIVTSDSAVLDLLEAHNQKVRGAGTISALASIFLASRYAADPATGIRVAAYENGIDTDTIASMTGGLLGAMVGDDWVPMWWRPVQDAPFLQLLARQFGVEVSAPNHERSVGPPLTRSWTDSDSRQVRDHLEEAINGRVVTIGLLGPVEIDHVDSLVPIAQNVRMLRYRARTRDGQTIFLFRGQRAITHQLSIGLETAREPGSKVREAGIVAIRESSLSLDEDQVPVSRAKRSEIDNLRRALPPEMSATSLLASIEDAVQAIEAIRAAESRAGAISKRDITDRLAITLRSSGHSLPEQALLPLARIAWHLSRPERKKKRNLIRDEE